MVKRTCLVAVKAGPAAATGFVRRDSVRMPAENGYGKIIRSILLPAKWVGRLELELSLKNELII